MCYVGHSLREEVRKILREEKDLGNRSIDRMIRRNIIMVIKCNSMLTVSD